MSFFVDTGDVQEAKQAAELGWVKGLTTNPLLLARSPRPPEETLRSLARLGFSSIFYQLTSDTLEGMQQEAAKAEQIVGRGLVLKIAPTELGFRALPVLSAAFPCCVTALYSLSQLQIASDLGASYGAIYVNRATRLMGDGVRLVEKAVRLLDGCGMQVLAASIKSIDEVEAVLAAGARHLTFGYELLKTLPNHELSKQAVEEFDKEGVGLSS